jgi:photosystem II stability/assembly factor-like uncharacterized protein
LFCIHFQNQQTGWVAGEGGQVLHTGDGGQTWQIQKLPTAEAIQSIAFTDDQRGLAGGGAGVLYRTADAGRNWTQIDLHTRVVINRLACYRGTGHCLIAGQRGLLLVGDPFRLYP